MIRIQQQPRPRLFNRLVRRPGLKFLSGLPNLTKINWKGHDYWRHVAADLYKSYNGICAYLCCPVGPASFEVEHYKPKSRFPKLAYDWSNYRLASSGINKRKGVRRVLDPFKVKADSFRINLFDGSIHVSGTHPAGYTKLCQDTIDALRLDGELERGSRTKPIDEYLHLDMSLNLMQRQYPFVYSELVRRGIVNRRTLNRHVGLDAAALLQQVI